MRELRRSLRFDVKNLSALTFFSSSLTRMQGYYMAAFLIDHKQYGRKWMQANGFVADFILFIIAAALYDQLTEPGSGIRWFQAIYFLSSFFNQFGPNATTFLAGESINRENKKLEKENSDSATEPVAPPQLSSGAIPYSREHEFIPSIKRSPEVLSQVSFLTNPTFPLAFASSR